MRFVTVDMEGHDGCSYSGVSFWKFEDLMYIKARLEEVDWENPKTVKMYWDNVLLPHLNDFPVYANVLEDNKEIYEIDDQEDLKDLNTYLKGE